MNLIGLDLDGTLGDSRSDMTAAVRRVRAQLGLSPHPDEAIRPWVNRGMDQLCRACFDDYLQEDEARLTDIRFRYESDYMENVVRETRLYPGIAAALEHLMELGRLAVVTNKPERISRRLLALLGVERFFTAVIGGDTCVQSKPDRMVLEEAARRCGFNTGNGRAFMIGDTAADLKLGRAFGATTIWCSWGYINQPGETPDFVAQTPTELPDLIRSALDTTGGRSSPASSATA